MNVIQCSNCGSIVPFAGNVCPLCHVDKSADKKRAIELNGRAAFLLAAIGIAFWLTFVFGYQAGIPGAAAGISIGVLLLLPWGRWIEKRRIGTTRFHCAACGTLMAGKRSAQGKIKACPKCKADVRIPTDYELANRKVNPRADESTTSV